jgi:hypothetical protein
MTLSSMLYGSASLPRSTFCTLSGGADRRYCVTIQSKYFGGEGGIRTRVAAQESVTYRFFVAAGATFAIAAVAHCPPLPTEVAVLVRTMRPHQHGEDQHLLALAAAVRRRCRKTLKIFERPYHSPITPACLSLSTLEAADRPTSEAGSAIALAIVAAPSSAARALRSFLFPRTAQIAPAATSFFMVSMIL